VEVSFYYVRREFPFRIGARSLRVTREYPPSDYLPFPLKPFFIRPVLSGALLNCPFPLIGPDFDELPGGMTPRLGFPRSFFRVKPTHFHVQSPWPFAHTAERPFGESSQIISPRKTPKWLIRESRWKPYARKFARSPPRGFRRRFPRTER